MPADFLTKWLTIKKFNNSVEYITNRYNKVYHPKDPDNPSNAKA